MAIINIYDTPFSTTPNVIEVDKKKTVKDFVIEYADNISTEEELVECYDLDTGETFFATVENEGYKVVAFANDKEVSIDYSIIENDIINIILIPRNKAGGVGLNTILEFAGAALVMVGVGMFTAGVGTVGMGILAGSLILGGLGLQIYAAWAMSDSSKDSKINDALDHESNLSISGCGNQEITDKCFPLILGKHLVNPYVVGSPYCTTLTKDFRGNDGGQYVTALYCVGYAPLKLTDFRIDQTYLAYNRNTQLIAGIPTVMHGQLKGCSSTSIDNGDILKKWKNNDVTIEILQAGNKCEDDSSRYGSIYPQVVEQLEVNANVVKIKDSLIESLASKIYKGASVPDGYMSNSVRFSRSCPQRIEVEIDFPNGLYAQRSYENNIYYYNLPVRLAIQWRFIKKGAASSDANSPVGWSNFDYIELTPNSNDTSIKTKIEPKLFTYEKKLYDYQSSRGQSDFTDSTGTSYPKGANGYYNYNNAAQIRKFADDDLWINSSNLFEFGTESQETVIKSVTKIDSKYETEYSWFVKIYKWKNSAKANGSPTIDYALWLPISKDMKFQMEHINYNIVPRVGYYKSGGVNIRYNNYSKCWVIYNNNIIVPNSDFKERKSESSGTYYIMFKNFVNNTAYNYYTISKEFSYKPLTLADNPSAYAKYRHSHSITELHFSPEQFKANFGVNERRYVIVKEFTDEECRKMIGYQTNDLGEKYSDIDSVEVRVLRINPSYLDETGTKSSEGFQNMSYQDLSKWTYLRTFSFDKKEYKKALDEYKNAHPNIKTSEIPEGAVSVKDYPLRPLSKEDMDKFCMVALTLKQDVAETGGKTLKKMDLIAESFSPKYNEEEDKWYPENINKKFKYYEITKKENSSGILEDNIEYFPNKSDYLVAKDDGRNVGITDDGNDFVDQLKDELFNEDSAGQYSSYNEYIGHCNPERVHSGEDFINAGWDGSSKDAPLYDGTWGTTWTATVTISEYNNTISANGDDDVAYVVSHVSGDGTIYSPETWNQKVLDIINEKSLDNEILLKVYSGKGCIEKGEHYSVSLHCLSSLYFAEYIKKLIDDEYTDEEIELYKSLFESIKGFSKNSDLSNQIKAFMKESLFLEYPNSDPTSLYNEYESYFKEVLVDFGYLRNLTSVSNYYLQDDVVDKYITRNAASVSLLTLVGRHLGKKSKTYDDVNMDSFTEFYNFCEDVTDGSYLANSTDLRHYTFECNGVVSQEIKFETLLQKVLLAGRASFRRDDENKYEIVIGKKNLYPTLMINQQNCTAFSNQREFNDKPSGFHCSFIDETDNYTTNDIYVMMDGEDYQNPTREIEELQIPYVTNREQLWSLARSNLGAKVLQREVYTRTVGKVGYTVSYGDVVLLQDATLLIGSDNGGRIREIIQDDTFIYGFTVNEPFIYSGKETSEGSGLCSQGVTILQPQKTGASRCVTLRLAMPSKVVEITSKPENTENRTKLQTKTLQVKEPSKTLGWTAASDELHNTIHTYRMKKGITNLVLLENPISRYTFDSKDCPPVLDEDNESYISVNVIPKYDNLVAFGEIGYITTKAMVISKKPQDGEKFQLTLIPYDDSLFEMGGTMPDFDAKMTQPSEDNGISFDGAITKDELITTAVNTTQSGISNLEKIITNITSLYSLDASPEFQTMPVSSYGTVISQDYVYIKAQFYYNTTPLITNNLTDGEELTFKAFYKNSEIGTWLIGDEYKNEIINQFGIYDYHPVVKIPTLKLVENNNILTIYAEYKKGEDVNAKTTTVTVAKLNYGDSLIWYDMAFPNGSGAVKRSIEKNAEGKYDYLPRKITASKRIVKMENDVPAYQPTEYGTIDVTYYDSEGNLIGTGDEKGTFIGSHYLVKKNDKFDETTEYLGKFNPFILKLGNESDGELQVLGFGNEDSGTTEDTAIVFYKRN